MAGGDEGAVRLSRVFHQGVMETADARVARFQNFYEEFSFGTYTSSRNDLTTQGYPIEGGC
eukprot:772637-Prymnesium_polylepis.1